MDLAEASGKTVDDAFKAALAMLGATADEVEMTVLDEGRKSGLFGRGSREATVRVERLAEGQAPAAPTPRVETDTSIPRSAPRRAPRPPRQPRERTAGLESAVPRLREEDFLLNRPAGGSTESPPRAPRPASRRPAAPNSTRQGPPPERRRRKEVTDVAPDINAEEVETAAQVLDDILAILKIPADITIREPLTPGDGLGSSKAVIDINGDDLGLLIGRRGDTLYSLQHMVNLVIGRRFPETAGVTLDVEHYRHRREEQLSALAGRMAERVRRTGSPITLEPMSPADRRLIHLALADDDEIETYSIGEGDARKVIINLRS